MLIQTMLTSSELPTELSLLEHFFLQRMRGFPAFRYLVVISHWRCAKRWWCPAAPPKFESIAGFESMIKFESMHRFEPIAGAAKDFEAWKDFLCLERRTKLRSSGVPYLPQREVWTCTRARTPSAEAHHI